ncbi:hypothetical protein BC938DRAFT_482005 [Jimgerdemannia flammicorona]|uniref:Uncharacterized protein n=1 Tax=Jimgerdemannia flammicorona TaxID=994334 RepID=A0A433QEX4_9FUNG|nr:hypothetical protein BC938DRAFT_482005 [Jimgerdemannia flammicorona]
MVKWDWDEILSYDTLKVVKVKDSRLGVLYYLCAIAIFAYIVINLVLSQGYLLKESPIPGAVRVSLHEPATIQTPSYCNGSTPCVYWSGIQIIYPADAFASTFLTTRIVVLQYPPQPNCDPIISKRPECIFSTRQPTNTSGIMYVADIESYTLMIEHSIRGKENALAIRNGLMDGSLNFMNGTALRTFTNATRMRGVDGDIMTVKELLLAAGADLDTPSYAPSADQSNGETCRSSGIVISVNINYANSPSNLDLITYQYLPQVIVGNEYKVEEIVYRAETTGGITVLNRHGIKIIFQQSGQIGTFHFITLLLNLVAGLALLKVATIVVELLMLRFLPQRRQYEAHKFEKTEDFSNQRKRNQSFVERGANGGEWRDDENEVGGGREGEGEAGNGVGRQAI